MIGDTYQGIEVNCCVDDKWVDWVIPNVQRVYFASPGSFWVAPTRTGLGRINIDYKRCEVKLIEDFYSVRIYEGLDK